MGIHENPRFPPLSYVTKADIYRFTFFPLFFLIADFCLFCRKGKSLVLTGQPFFVHHMTNKIYYAGNPYLFYGANIILPPRILKIHNISCRCRTVALCHRRSIRAAATALPPLRCAPPPRFVLLPPPLMLPLPPYRRQASTDVAMARCRHRQRCAVALLPPPQTLPPSEVEPKTIFMGHEISSFMSQ